MDKKIYRSEENKIFLGICGGIGEYFNIDPVLVRLGFVVLCCVGFFISGLVAYIIAAFIVPKKIAGANENVQYEYKKKDNIIDVEPEDFKNEQ